MLGEGRELISENYNQVVEFPYSKVKFFGEEK